MKIRELSVVGFRNLRKMSLEFDDRTGVHVFAGANGQGKTNILEAIYLCSLSKSFRSRAGSDLIAFDEDFSSVKVTTESEKLEVIMTARPPRKVFKVNGVKKPATEFIGRLTAVFFSPDDLSEMSFSPRLRRRYLDILLCQMDRSYLGRIMEYNAACRQRNSLLKAVAGKEAAHDELDFWDERLAERGASIVFQREDIITRIKDAVGHHYGDISRSDAPVDIIYESRSRGASADELKKRYKEGRGRDLATGQTHLGPHRDDLRFMLNGRDMAFFASRGEWRSLVLALKFAEIGLIKGVTGDDPILLLDDVFSELDAERQKALFDVAGRGQTFLTTTHDAFVRDFPGGHRIYKVHSGNAESV